MKTCIGLLFLLMPIILWTTAIGYILGFKVMLLLALIIPIAIVSAACKIIGKIILAS